MGNIPGADYQGVGATIVDRGESFNTRARLVACLHGGMRQPQGRDYATLIELSFASEGSGPGVKVVDVAPRNFKFSPTSEVRTAELSLSLSVLPNVGSGLACWHSCSPRLTILSTCI